MESTERQMPVAGQQGPPALPPGYMRGAAGELIPVPDQPQSPHSSDDEDARTGFDETALNVRAAASTEQQGSRESMFSLR